ncbi:hypothetical protein [Nakamurella sp. PAMC28650]|uniref:hypothetical protein n=1 Tax=Nakamurella sp. PAMC28650 TaxID=2762325 RepID=UPI00164DAF73|nr:hypothetical protein [Nakamurella sp. PAMC28650]QNK79315.1 hypothetical protein H7F38_13380 [Nakamurella sp. PAMC28650]
MTITHPRRVDGIELADQIRAHHPEIPRPVCPKCGRVSEGRVGAASHSVICSHKLSATEGQLSVTLTTAPLTCSTHCDERREHAFDSEDEHGRPQRFHAWRPRLESHAYLAWHETYTQTGGVVTIEPTLGIDVDQPLDMAGASQLALDIAACVAKAKA